jgi:hypothetical protein
MLGRKPSAMFGRYRAMNVGLGSLCVLLGLGGILALIKLR